MKQHKRILGTFNGVHVRSVPLMEGIQALQGEVRRRRDDVVRGQEMLEASHTVTRRLEQEVGTLRIQLEELGRRRWIRLGLWLRLLRWPVRRSIEPKIWIHAVDEATPALKRCSDEAHPMFPRSAAQSEALDAAAVGPGVSEGAGSARTAVARLGGPPPLVQGRETEPAPGAAATALSEGGEPA